MNNVVTKKIPTSLYLDPDLKARLEKMSAAQRRSLTNLIEGFCLVEVEKWEEENGK